MKNKITFLSTAMLLIVSLQTEAQTTNTLYPGVTSIDRTYMARKVSVPPTIDGNPADAAWSNAAWRQAASTTVIDGSWSNPAGTPLAPEGAFAGSNDMDLQYKIVWDDNHYYILFRIKDDNVIYSDVHNGYRTGSVPAYAAAVTATSPAPGTGTGAAYQAFRMDQVAFWFTPHTAALESGGAYNRANNGVLHNLFPGQLSQSTKPGESVLWAPKHNPVSNVAGTPQTHVGTAAGSTTAGGDGYTYIEFRDDTWATLFSTVRTKLVDQKLYSATVLPAVGDKFLLQGEVNDADGTTNRRDYVNYFTHHDNALNPSTSLREALVITLAEENGLSVKSQTAVNSLKFYVDRSSILRFNEILDVEIYNMVGQRVIKSVKSAEVNLSALPKGVYVVKDKEGKSGKLILE